MAAHFFEENEFYQSFFQGSYRIMELIITAEIYPAVTIDKSIQNP